MAADTPPQILTARIGRIQDKLTERSGGLSYRKHQQSDLQKYGKKASNRTQKTKSQLIDVDKVLHANGLALSKNTNLLQVSKDPVTVDAQYMNRNQSSGSINLQMQRKSGSVVGLMRGHGFVQPDNKYNHVKSRL